MRCPQCQYDLSGTDPALSCPECGTTREQRAMLSSQGDRYTMPLVFAWSALLSVIGLGAMTKGIHLLAFPIVYGINALPLMAAWGLLSRIVQPRNKGEALWASIPSGVAVCGLLLFLYYDAFVKNTDALNGLVLLFSPVLTIPVALIMSLGGWCLVRASRRP